MKTEAAKEWKDGLSAEEMAAEQGPLLIPGRPYLWVMTHGWGIVAFYVRWETPLRVRVAHANHFHEAKKDYGALAQEGAGKDCQWRYEGSAELTFPHLIRWYRYHGDVPRGPIRVR